MKIKMLKDWKTFKKDTEHDIGGGVATELIRRKFAVQIEKKGKK